MDAIGLALVSAALFGAMPVAVRAALVHPLPAAVGTLYMQVTTLAILAAAATVQGGITIHGLVPFFVAGAIAPGLSQLLIIVAIREAGSSRTSVAVGTAPLIAVALAVIVFGESPSAGVLIGALLVVGGGIALVVERDRPAHVRRLGIVLALTGAALFALRDNLLRHLSLETDVPSMTAGTATLVAGMAVTLTVVLVRGHPLRTRPAVAARWLVPGACIGLSYLALFEALYRGEVSIVAPIIGTESLWGVALSALFLRRSEAIGVRLVLGALLVVAGSVLIGLSR